MRILSTRLLHTAATVSSLLARSVSTGSMAHSSSHRLIRVKNSLVLEPSAGHCTGSVIFMHGLGDSASGWIDTVASEFAPFLPQIKFILPTAPTRPVTINGGMPMPAWYDIESLSGDRSREVCDGIRASSGAINALIAGEVERGVPTSRVLLGGFSQGGAMTLFVGLNHPAPLAGMLVMSGYMPLPASISPSSDVLRVPILMCHGDEDAVVPLHFARDALARVKAMGATSVEFKTYEGMPHSASREEIADALAFIKRQLPPLA